MKHIYNQSFVNEIIALAWADNVSFDSIRHSTGLLKKEVIKIMRMSLKPSSFALWRKRVSGRKLKHSKKSLFLYESNKYNAC